MPDEIGLDCLVRVPCRFHSNLKSVCQRWRNLLSHPSFHRERRKSGTAEHLVCLVQALSSDSETPEEKREVGRVPLLGLSIYNGSDNTWQRMRMRMPLFCQCVALPSSGKLLLLGGWDPTTLHSVADVHVFDFIRGGGWRRGTPMSVERSFFACAAVGPSSVYVAGGHDNQKNALRSAEVYDADADEWRTLPEMCEERDECQGLCCEGDGDGDSSRFWVVSGYGSERQGRFLTDGECYDPVSASWTKVEFPLSSSEQRGLGIGMEYWRWWKMLDSILISDHPPRDRMFVMGSDRHGAAFISERRQSNLDDSEVHDLLGEMKNSEDISVGHIFYKLMKEIGSPVDFQLPDWLRKRKPNPYTFIRRNIYLAKKIKRRLEDDGIFCSCSLLLGSSSVCGRDCHCGMLLSSCSSSCKCGVSCLNKPFQLRTVKKMKLVETEKCGSGLVAEEEINQGEFVIEYVGEVIDDKTCEERLWTMKDRGETNFYLCEINRDMVIDATYKGNKSRYINHSCQPNTEMQKWRIDGETRIGIFATRDIKRGEHLTYDYQYEHFTRLFICMFVQFGADQNCYCGAVGCRQKLGVKPSKPKLSSSDAALKLVACQVAASSPKMQAILSGKDLLERKREEEEGIDAIDGVFDESPKSF
ncbi:hypothetical protein HHK36_013401 [Tetracentron sinense]|uniref:Histone-lysine N-methyltransferase ASHH3 n=1 Tax=Tetracentron sinense TaxID=13715 RepID=A0A834ZB16_TETSI|nr:hypothetical protein HHK36_013401 [Tetracentron sinense]